MLVESAGPFVFSVMQAVVLSAEQSQVVRRGRSAHRKVRFVVHVQPPPSFASSPVLVAKRALTFVPADHLMLNLGLRNSP